MIRALVRPLCGVLVRPRQTLRKIAERPPLGLALGWLLATTALQGWLLIEPEWEALAPIFIAIGVPVIAVLYCGAALLCLGIARWQRVPVQYDSLLCLIIFAGVPWLLSSAAEVWARQSYAAYRGWQVLELAVAAWTSALLLVGLRAAYGLAVGRALLVALPVLLVDWPVAVWNAYAAAPPMKAVYPWQRTEGQRVTLFCPQGKSRQEVNAIVRGCDQTVAKVCRVLDVGLPDFKVEVFLFPNTGLHRRAVGGEEPDGTSYAHGRSISALYDPWPELRCTAVHEVGHVVVAHRVVQNAPAFLDEGIATFLEAAVAPEACCDDGDGVLRPLSELRLRLLVRSELFWDDHQAQQVGADDFTLYNDAGSFVQYLARQHGMPKLKRLCREWAVASGLWNLSEDEADAFGRIIQSIYGQPLDRLESRWRGAQSSTGITTYSSSSSTRS